MAVQTRHAGFSIVDLSRVHVATLALFCLCMFLAPTPLTVAMDNSTARRRLLRSLHREDAPQEDGAAEPDGVVPEATELEGAGGTTHLQLLPGADQSANVQRGEDTARHERMRRRLMSTLLASEVNVGSVGDPSARRMPLLSTFSNSFGADDSETAMRNYIQRDVDTRLYVTIQRMRAHAAGKAVSRWLKLQTDMRALRVDVGRVAHDAIFTPCIRRDALVIFFGWFVLLCGLDGHTPAANGGRPFYALFEVCSAIGNVGLSLGPYNNTAGVKASYSYDLCTFGKLIIVAVMMYGKCRALPSSVDAALLLLQPPASCDMMRNDGTINTAESSTTETQPSWQPPTLSTAPAEGSPSCTERLAASPDPSTTMEPPPPPPPSSDWQAPTLSTAPAEGSPSCTEPLAASPDPSTTMEPPPPPLPSSDKQHLGY